MFPPEYKPVEGNCPECGRLFSAPGQQSLWLAIGCHLHDEHGYPTRFWHPDKALTPARYPNLQDRLPLRQDADEKTIADYYAGSMLTAFDKGFLSFGGHGNGVCWNAPDGWPPDES